jgi:hypothetical protein
MNDALAAVPRRYALSFTTGALLAREGALLDLAKSLHVLPMARKLVQAAAPVPTPAGVHCTGGGEFLDLAQLMTARGSAPRWSAWPGGDEDGW